MRKKLRVSSERIRNLTAGQLRGIAGGTLPTELCNTKHTCQPPSLGGVCLGEEEPQV